MDRLPIIESSTRMPATTMSSGLHPVTTTSNLGASAEELFSTAVAHSIKAVGLGGPGSSRRRSDRMKPPQWARVRDALSVGGMAATRRGRAQPPAVAASADGRAEAAIADGRAEAAIADGRTETASIDGRAEAANAGERAEAAPANPIPKPSSAPSRVELTIDSLRTYELVKPIPVFVEALGERHYVGEVPDLNMTISASSLGDTLIVLKNNIVQTYDELRIRRSLDTEQVRQLKALESYIGKSKRGWLDRR